MAEPVGPDGFAAIADAALELKGVDGAEVVLMREWGGLTRFASNQIHQSTWTDDADIRVRVVTNGRVGVASSNVMSPEGALAAARNAREMAEVVTADPQWPGLPQPARYPEADRYFPDVVSATPGERAEAVAQLVAQCPDGFTASGAYETRGLEVGVANTEGVRAWIPWTQASLTTVVTGGEGGSGFAERFAPTTKQIDPEAIGRTAAAKAEASQRPSAIDPGSYAVVLEPSATATLVGFLAWTGFGGREYIEGRSCLSGRAGELVADSKISIWDDGASTETLGTPFDFEGVPRVRTDLIRDGVFIDAVYDRRTAAQAGREEGSTGHALPAPNPEGPFPLNLFLAAGDATVQEMIEATQRGLLVTRFHYTNIVNPMESSITGMTRDGTFLIENGEITGPVRNLRFTQSILAALSAVTLVGIETELASEFFFSASRVPALRIEEFSFSGASDH